MQPQQPTTNPYNQPVPADVPNQYPAQPQPQAYPGQQPYSNPAPVVPQAGPQAAAWQNPAPQQPMMPQALAQVPAPAQVPAQPQAAPGIPASPYQPATAPIMNNLPMVDTAEIRSQSKKALWLAILSFVVLIVGLLLGYAAVMGAFLGAMAIRLGKQSGNKAAMIIGSIGLLLNLGLFLIASFMH